MKLLKILDASLHLRHGMRYPAKQLPMNHDCPTQLKQNMHNAISQSEIAIHKQQNMIEPTVQNTTLMLPDTQILTTWQFPRQRTSSIS
jgi:hypothetical protein